MYIKQVRKRNRGGKKDYVYLHLVENVRTERGPRQRLLLNLGTLPIDPEDYKALANTIEGLLLGQDDLISPAPRIERHARNAVQRLLAKNAGSKTRKPSELPAYQLVDVASMQATEVRSLGAESVGHQIWQALGFNRALVDAGCSPQWLPLCEALVVGRLVAPGSERYSWAWMQNRSAIFELTGRPVHCSLNALYRATDVLFSYKDALEKHLSERERDLFALPERLCLFDLTNTYFEGQAAGNAKAKRGRSKEKRSDAPLLTLALIIDEQGFPKYSRLYPGNQCEAKTLIEMIEALIQARPDLARDRTVILDAGIATEANIQRLREQRFHYICVSRTRAEVVPEHTDDLEIIREDPEKAVKIEVKRFKKDHEIHLLCRSTGRQEKDRAIRTRQEQLFIERLTYFRDGLKKKGHIKRYDRVLELVGRLREKYPRASKVFDVQVIPADELVKDIVWKKRDGYEHQDKLDGCYLLRTDREDLSDAEILETYVMLTRIETSFRALKSSLGLRPIFHQKEDRADAHLFISVLAYHLLVTIEHRLRSHADHRCWASVRDVLSTHQRLTIEYREKTHSGRQQHHLRLCSQPEPEHKLIYERLALDAEPLPRRRYVGK